MRRPPPAGSWRRPGRADGIVRRRRALLPAANRSSVAPIGVEAGAGEDATVKLILRDGPLDWRGVAAVAEGSGLVLSEGAWAAIAAAERIVAAVAEHGPRAYGVNTGVGALSDTLVPRDQQARLSRNLLMSHAAGVGEPLPEAEVRAVMAAQVNNHAHGRSGLRVETVEALLGLLAAGCCPEVPARGSVGYLTHMAHIGLVLIGEGRARVEGRLLEGGAALSAIGRRPLRLVAKEGLSLVNGTPCATGLACLALHRIGRLLDGADAVAALTLEALGAGIAAFDADVLAVRRSPGLQASGAALRARLAGSGALDRDGRTQDALSLRAVPHLHGAVRDAWAAAGAVVDRELASVTDNPIVSGTPEAPVVQSEAHAVAPALALALDGFAIAVAQLAAMAERRLDRMLNPAVSGLPPFLSADPGVGSGYMIAQYTAAALVGENRRLAAPASLDGGITSALQEDVLAHPTAAATKLLAIVDNAERILGIELLAGVDAHGLADRQDWAPGTAVLLAQVRARAAPYRDDRPLADHLAVGRDLVRAGLAPVP